MATAENEIYDATLMGILQKEGQIAKFLDVVMGFLYRRTDYYHIMESRDSKLGFPQGVAQRLLIQAYEKYEKLSEKRDNAKDTRTVIPSRPDQKDLKNKKASDVTNSSSQNPPPTIQTSESSEKTPTKNTETLNSQQVFQENPESHNGAMRDGYRWAQTLTDCDLRIEVPSTVLKAKQVSVNIKRKHISASYIDEENQVVELVDSDLAWDVNVEESMWSLVPKDCIHINLEKVQERWWEQVFVEEPKINTRKIEASVSMEHLDDGAQSAIGKLMYDERQKKLGLPTSSEQEMQNMLKKAWNSEGSPFQGMPYDPSIVNTSGMNSQFK
ncbi:NUDCD3 [Bugula neritina]|uniref:NUDCD3 n=1 Tax=Bugula neritina TaxID=10212 RepID=A0A7J7J2I6_BUGNE|nr:NUDCD3 [Bugula neritina]